MAPTSPENERCGTTPGAASKRYSRMKQAFEAGEAAPEDRQALVYRRGQVEGVCHLCRSHRGQGGGEGLMLSENAGY
jgi:hypothetical protein